MQKLVSELRQEDSLRYKVEVELLGADPVSETAGLAAQTVKTSRQVQELLDFCISSSENTHPYKKWHGSHWVLAQLADLGYPAGDESLRPLLERSYEWLLGEHHQQYLRMINGRMRRCASQESNAVYTSLKLGLDDARTDELASRLMQWQWADGGWNCDKRPQVERSSFMESLIPLRALVLYAQVRGDSRARACADHAAEVFLKRKLYQRVSDGQVMDKHFVLLHYPNYWHYDILFGLKVLLEAGKLSDPRCQPALDLLESKRLPDGGFPSEGVYYHHREPDLSGFSPVSWGGISKRRYNPFVTADALIVLKAAGRS